MQIMNAVDMPVDFMADFYPPESQGSGRKYHYHPSGGKDTGGEEMWDAKGSSCVHKHLTTVGSWGPAYPGALGGGIDLPSELLLPGNEDMGHSSTNSHSSLPRIIARR